jgi:hypothetical protein
MGKVLAAVLGLAVVAGTAYYVLNGSLKADASSGKSAPKQQLDNVREAAKRIENDAQRRADEAGKMPRTE